MSKDKQHHGQARERSSAERAWTRTAHAGDQDVRPETWASTTYGELVDRAAPAGERHASTISIALDIKTAGRATSTSAVTCWSAKMISTLAACGSRLRKGFGLVLGRVPGGGSRR
jgi:hypothetical protein